MSEVPCWIQEDVIQNPSDEEARQVGLLCPFRKRECRECLEYLCKNPSAFSLAKRLVDEWTEISIKAGGLVPIRAYLLQNYAKFCPTASVQCLKVGLPVILNI